MGAGVIETTRARTCVTHRDRAPHLAPPIRRLRMTPSREQDSGDDKLERAEQSTYPPCLHVSLLQHCRKPNEANHEPRRHPNPASLRIATSASAPARRAEAVGHTSSCFALSEASSDPILLFIFAGAGIPSWRRTPAGLADLPERRLQSQRSRDAASATGEKHPRAAPTEMFTCMSQARQVQEGCHIRASIDQTEHQDQHRPARVKRAARRRRPSRG